MAEKRIPAKKLSFGDAVGEVEQILEQLEDGEVDIDELSSEVKRAVELIQVCRTKLDRTEGEVRELVSGLQPADGQDKTEGASATGEDVPF